jgi:hypothetical protein
MRVYSEYVLDVVPDYSGDKQPAFLLAIIFFLSVLEATSSKDVTPTAYWVH